MHLPREASKIKKIKKAKKKRKKWGKIRHRSFVDTVAANLFIGVRERRDINTRGVTAITILNIHNYYQWRAMLAATADHVTRSRRNKMTTFICKCAKVHYFYWVC